MKSIFILHPGKANYPEIEAYKKYFAGQYKVEDGGIADYEALPNKSEIIVWCIMGFFPKSLKAKVVIHDYRSLSVGQMPALKDFVKRGLNSKPNIRIFQNDIMRAKMSFKDKVPSYLLPMGVPDFISNVSPHVDETLSSDFCYIGEMSYERGFDKMLDAFLTNASHSQLTLIGTPEDKILNKYGLNKCLNFIGRKSQQETLSIVKASKYAICFFPYHRPHCFQAPTKLLEYMALGVRIVCNDSPSNLRTAEEFNYPCFFTGPNIFDFPELESSLASYSTDFSRSDKRIKAIDWHSVISESGIDAVLQSF